MVVRPPQNYEVISLQIDYFCLGTLYKRTWRDHYMKQAQEKAWSIGRFRIEKRHIFCDGLKVGEIKGGTGGESTHGWKLKWHFTGSWFREGLTVEQAQWLVLAAEIRMGMPEAEDAAYRAMAHTARMAYMAPESQDAQTAKAKAETAFDEIRVICANKERPKRRFTTIDRLDYAIELELPPGVHQAPKYAGTEEQFTAHKMGKGWKARTVVDSEDGTTVYVGRRQHPLKDRGEAPLLRIYQYKAPVYKGSKPSSDDARQRRMDELAKARRIRFEIEIPNVINVNSKRTLGPNAAAQLAAQILAGALGRRRALPIRLGEEDTRVLSVPVVELEQRAIPQTLKGKPFISHATAELRRLIRGGFGINRSVARTLRTAVWDAKLKDIPAEIVEAFSSQEIVTIEEIDEQLDELLALRATLHPRAAEPAFKTGLLAGEWDHWEKVHEMMSRYMTTRDDASPHVRHQSLVT